MSTELITIRELLSDPQYKAYFTQVPKLPAHYTVDNLPWKLMVLKPGEHAWRTKRFGTYPEAFAGFKRMLPTIENAAINCRPVGFLPPTYRVRVKGQFDKKGKQLIAHRLWKPQITEDMATHNWCPHCRRPTVFIMAVLPPRHREGFDIPFSEPALRCGICGISERMVDLRHPENSQNWDVNRVRVSA